MDPYSSIKCEVGEYKLSSIDTSVILFMLTVTKRDGTVWQLEKRYSEYDELNNTLKKVNQEFCFIFP